MRTLWHAATDPPHTDPVAADAVDLDVLHGPPPAPFATPDAPGPPSPPSPSVPVGAPHPSEPTSPGRRTALVIMAAAAAICGALAGAISGYVVADNTSSTGQATTTIVAGAAALDVPAIVAKAGPSVVTIETTISTRVGPRTTTGSAAGTGIILTGAGMVLTNAHVIAGATSISVTLAGETSGHDATVLMTDTSHDVAVVQMSGTSGLTPASLATSGDIRVGEDVVAIGNALALEGGPTVTKGIVSGLERSITTDTTTLSGLLQTDAAISSGDSGGPLLDRTGTVIGLTCAGASSGQSVIAENVGFAIPIGRVMAVLQQAGIVVG